jgi:hypothetical protein
LKNPFSKVTEEQKENLVLGLVLVGLGLVGLVALALALTPALGLGLIFTLGVLP